VRRSNDSIVKHALQWAPEGTSIRQQPRNTWKRDSNNYSWKMMEAAVKDEAKWKTVVHGVYPKAL